MANTNAMALGMKPVLLDHIHIYMGVFTGGGGGHSDAKWEIFQFSPFFSKMSFRRGRYVVPF